jgi:hypothetical protein
MANLAAGASVRFFGTAANGIDRVLIPVGTQSGAPGPPTDIGATDFTIEFWMRTADANTAPAPTCNTTGYDWIWGSIILDRDRLGAGGRDFGLAINAGRIAFGLENGAGQQFQICSSRLVNDGVWHHIAVQRRRSDGWLWLYVDGALQATQDGPDGDLSLPDVPAYDPREPFISLGAEKYDLVNIGFRGWLDELRLSTVLRYPTPSSLAGAPSFTPAGPFISDGSTAGLYHFDEGTGLIARDASAGATDAQLRVGGSPQVPQWSTETPFSAAAQPTLRFASAALNVSESVGTVDVAVLREVSLQGVVSASYSVAGSASGGADYAIIGPTTVTWPDAVATQSIRISIVDDSVLESGADETIVLTLTSASAGTIGIPATTTIAIADNDAPPPSAGQVAFAASTISVSESAGTVTLNVTRSGGSAGAVTVAFGTSGGTATSGADFTATSGTLSWADGQSGSRNIVVPLANDTTYESDETFTVALSGATGGLTLGAPAVATVTILDDDPPPALPPPSPSTPSAGGGGSIGWLTIALLALGLRHRRRLRSKL